MHERWLRFVLGALRVGFAVAFPDGIERQFGTGGLRARLESMVANGDWAAKLCLAELLVAEAKFREPASNQHRRGNVQGAAIAKEVVESPGVSPAARAIARSTRAEHLLALGEPEEAMRELERARAEGHGRPDYCAHLIVEALELLDRFPDAIEW